MPELPEAETIRRQLEPQVVGQRIKLAWARLPRITQPSIEEFVGGLKGRRITAASRRGKQLYFPLDDGNNLLIHLGMTGRLHVEPSDGHKFDPEALHKYVHAAIVFEDGRKLVFADPRTFGLVGISRDLPFLESMGPEPLDEGFDEAALVAKLARRSTKIKAIIMDQHLVAGLGNIYADEVCFLAKVHPEQRASDLSKKKLAELVGYMPQVLCRAIEAGGATLKDGGYRDTFGVQGKYLPYAYGNAGQPCPNCGTTIQRGVMGPGKSARSYFFCPKCQRLKP